MLRALLVALTISLLPATLSAAQSDSVPPELERVTERFLDHFRDGDLEALAGLFAQDASYVPIAGAARINGRDGIRGYYQRVFANSKSRSITPLQVRWQRFGDLAIRSADARIDQVLPNGNSASTPARITFVYRLHRGEWTIVHHHSSVQPPTPKPAGS
jgi:uncharacterized protein (TIGR02246 family)